MFGIIYLKKKNIRMMMTILTLQQYYNELLILQQHSIYNVLNGHCKVPAIFQKPFQQLYKYSCNIEKFRWNIFEIFPQYYGAMWELSFKYSWLALHFSDINIIRQWSSLISPDAEILATTI